MSENPFEAPCVFCGEDVMAGADHTDDCPSNLGVFPVREEDLLEPGSPCEKCGHRNVIGMRCAECNAEFKVGDHYAFQIVENRDEDIRVIVCLGCAVLTPTTTLEDDE